MTISVAGDVTIDWFSYPVEAHEHGSNWLLHPASHMEALPGGAALLSKLVLGAVEAADLESYVIGPFLDEDIRSIRPEAIIHSNAELALCEHVTDKRDANSSFDLLRVSDAKGFMGPRGDADPSVSFTPDGTSNASIVVLDDHGNGFRSREEEWPLAVRGAGSSPLVFHKMRRPLAQGPLFDHLTSTVGAASNLVTIVLAEDLRATEGVCISKGLSWERTARETLFQLQRSARLSPLLASGYVVVLYDTDGALVCGGREHQHATLIFDASQLECGFSGKVKGTVFGLASMVTASIVAEVAAHRLPSTENGARVEERIPSLHSGIKKGLSRARTLLEYGYACRGAEIRDRVQGVFDESQPVHDYASCIVDPATVLNDPDPDYWRIFDQNTRHTYRRVAQQIVRSEGESVASLRDVPRLSCGKLVSIDRAEIEAYSAIRTLIAEFLEITDPRRPLCFGVFGPPGSGKSFGVEQLAIDANVDDRMKIRTYNVSQFRDEGDLIAAFHEIRDLVLKGTIPLAFFDEFDCKRGEMAFGWLSSFLAPMQDGEFKDGELAHPIGKAIFVFAGGVCSSFEEFAHGAQIRSGPQAGAQKRPRSTVVPTGGFAQAKGPDFVSRLRGFINVMGPNRQRAEDDAYVVRRAQMIRSHFSRNPKTSKTLFTSRGELRIDPSALRALLNVSRYEHGTRSIEAIIDMSRLAGGGGYGRSALPPKDQLDLHVDSDEFLFLAARERYRSMLTPRELSLHAAANVDPVTDHVAAEDAVVLEVARKIHDYYVKYREIDGSLGSTEKDFDKLETKFKKSNIDAAEDVPTKLWMIEHGLRQMESGVDPNVPDVSDRDVLKLAVHEHERWCRERRAQGDRWGPVRMPEEGLHPNLVAWEYLDPAIQQYDVEAVYSLPCILRDVGYEIYRMREPLDIESSELVASLTAEMKRCDLERSQVQATRCPDSALSVVAFPAFCPKFSGLVLRKLVDSGFEIVPGQSGATDFGNRLAAELAELGHTRWKWQRLLAGWAYAKISEEVAAASLSPYLTMWADLPASVRRSQTSFMKQQLPELIDAAGWTLRPSPS